MYDIYQYNDDDSVNGTLDEIFTYHEIYKTLSV